MGDQRVGWVWLYYTEYIDPPAVTSATSGENNDNFTSSAGVSHIKSSK